MWIRISSFLDALASGSRSARILVFKIRICIFWYEDLNFSKSGCFGSLLIRAGYGVYCHSHESGTFYHNLWNYVLAWNFKKIMGPNVIYRNKKQSFRNLWFWQVPCNKLKTRETEWAESCTSSTMAETPSHFFKVIFAATIEDKNLVTFPNFYILVLRRF